jgi:hypothetical protein
MAVTLNGINLSIGGEIEYFKCVNCSKEVFGLMLSADTDMVYYGIFSVSSMEKNELVITYLTPYELNNWNKFPKRELASRINKSLSRNDLVYIDRKSFELKNGESVFVPACPQCEGRTLKVNSKSLEEFMIEGGNIITIPG